MTGDKLLRAEDVLTDADIEAVKALTEIALAVTHMFERGGGNVQAMADLKVHAEFVQRRFDTLPPAPQAEEAERLREALEPLARLEVPKKPNGNAGAYSIRHEDILTARAALHPQEKREQD